MDKQANIESDLVTAIINATAGDVSGLPGTWVDVTSENPPPGIGWSYVGGVFSPPAPGPVRYRTILSGTEWVEEFTDAEWSWLKARRNDGTSAGDRLDQMLDAIRWTASIDVSASTMDEFYNWMLAQGIPGGQARIDELREGVAI